MVFSGTVFLFAFFPLFLAVCFALPWRPAKNVVLLLFSLLFYAWGEPVYVFLMIGSIVINWLMALLIDRFPEKGARLGALVVALAVNIGILGLFKHETFVATNVNLALGEEFLVDLQLALPIGISFFTLQAISYIGLHLPDLLRFLGIFGYGHRHGQDDGLQLPAELQLPVSLQKHWGILAPLAYDPRFLVPGLRLHPHGRKPGGNP